MPRRPRMKTWGVCLDGRSRLVVAAASRKRAAAVLADIGITERQFLTHGYRTRDGEERDRASRTPETVLLRMLDDEREVLR